MRARRWFGSTYFALFQSRVVRSLRQTPLLGAVVHGISHLLLLWNARAWVEVESGIRRGLKLHLNPRYDSGYWRGDYEEDIQAILAKHLKPGAVVYDVGAHLGFFALIAARLVGPGGIVFAFEPDPDNASRIREHIEANSFKRVSVVTSPVWSSNARVFFARASDHSSRFVGSVTTEGDGTEGFYEQAVTLDDFAREHARPDFIKMDIEGGETEALNGASHVFRKIRPLLLLEVHNGAAEEHVKTRLRDWGYSYEWLQPGPASLPCHLMAWPETRSGN